MESAAHVTTWCVVKKKEEFLGGLEGIFKADNERMTHVCQHISFRLGILDQVLTQDLFLIEDFHCKEFTSLLRVTSVSIKSEFFDQIDDSKRALSQLHESLEVLWADKVLLLLIFSLQLLIKLPNLDKLVLPARVSGSGLSRVINLYLLCLGCGLFLLLFLKALDKGLFVVILLLDVLLQLSKLVHKIGDFGHSIVALEHSRIGAPAVLVLVLLVAAKLVATLHADQLT